LGARGQAGRRSKPRQQSKEEGVFAKWVRGRTDFCRREV